MSCCLRRYVIVAWENGTPVAEYYGRENWKTDPPSIDGPDGQKLPWPGEEDGSSRSVRRGSRARQRSS